jgi:hypothetical protein
MTADRTNRLGFEYQQEGVNGIFKNSGIFSSNSDIWIHRTPKNEIFIFHTKKLKEFIEKCNNMDMGFFWEGIPPQSTHKVRLRCLSLNMFKDNSEVENFCYYFNYNSLLDFFNKLSPQDFISKVMELKSYGR